MPDYQKGKIYKIWDNAYNKCYIGSTCAQLSSRMVDHRKNYKMFKKGNPTKTYITIYDLFDEFGVDNCKIELLELYPTNSRAELLAREGYYQRENACVNKLIADRKLREYYNDNKEKYKQRHHQYYYDNWDACRERGRKWKERNKDHKRETDKKYREEHKEEIRKKGQELYTCDCGVVLTKGCKSKHQKRTKHQQYLNSLSLQEPQEKP